MSASATPPVPRAAAVEPELIPPGVGDPADAARVKRIRFLARVLDNAFRLPGTNVTFGWDQLIGLIPGGGDVATGLLAAYIVAEAAKLGVPKRTLWRMAANVTVDVVGGAVPIAGDLFDFAFKANKKNLKLVERHLESRGASERLSTPRDTINGTAGSRFYKSGG